MHYLIVELDLNDNRFINPLDSRALAWMRNGLMSFIMHLRVTAGEEQNRLLQRL